uniref:Uncharacterized protein n=1 Tax=Anguilla anguilla TaxID=7936 RepID=A0A0E9V7E8_ANGAN
MAGAVTPATGATDITLLLCPRHSDLPVGLRTCALCPEPALPCMWPPSQLYPLAVIEVRAVV